MYINPTEKLVSLHQSINSWFFIQCGLELVPRFQQLYCKFFPRIHTKIDVMNSEQTLTTYHRAIDEFR